MTPIDPFEDACVTEDIPCLSDGRGLDGGEANGTVWRGRRSWWGTVRIGRWVREEIGGEGFERHGEWASGPEGGGDKGPWVADDKATVFVTGCRSPTACILATE